MNNENKTDVNPAKSVKPTPLPIKETRNDGEKYRHTLNDNQNKAKK